MIVHLMVYATLVSLCSALGAVVAEWTLSLRRGLPVRWVWLAGMIVTVAMPLAWGSPLVQRGNQREPVEVALPQSSTMTSAGVRGSDRASRTAELSTLPQIQTDSNTAAATRALESMFTIPLPSARTALIVGVVWASVSLGLCAALFWSLRRLAHERARWTRVGLQGTTVLVSDGFGPALIGFRVPQIVVPPWVMALEASSMSMILSHELEHRRAGDSRAMMCATLVTIAMPWNPLLWWMLARFVRAVEFDCDARVIARGVKGAQYADLLLGAWQHATPDRRFTFAAAFAEHRSRLGQRVTHLLRPEPRRKAMKTFTGAILSLALAGTVVLAPSPRVADAQLPSATESVGQGGPARLVVIDGQPRPDLLTREQQGAEWRSRAGGAELVMSSWLDSVNARRLFGSAGARGADVWWSREYTDRLGPQYPVFRLMIETLPSGPLCSVSSEVLAQRVGKRLLSGIEMSAARRAESDRVVLQYVTALRAIMPQSPVVRTPMEIALADRRDSALRSLLVDETQRALFEQRLADERRFLVPIGVVEQADMIVRGHYFSDEVAASDAEIAAAGHVVERSLIDEAALLTRAPVDSGALIALRERRDAGVRAVLDSEVQRAAFDRRYAFWARARELSSGKVCARQ